MADKLQLEVVLDMLDKATGPIKKIMQGSQGLAKAVKEAKDRLRELDKVQGQIDGFKKLAKDAAITNKQLEQANAKVKALEQAFDKADKPTRQMTRDLAEAEKAAKSLSVRSETLNRGLVDAKERLAAAGISTNNLKAHQAELAAKTQMATAALDKEKAALERVNARIKATAQANAAYQKTIDRRNRFAGAGVGMVGAGAAGGAVVGKSISAYAESEDAATQLKAAMLRKGAQIGPEFQQEQVLAERLGNLLPGTTAELTDMMTMLQREGISAKAILGGIGEATAYLGVQLKMPYQDAAEFSAKLQDATRTTEKDMMGLMDVIQRTFYLGVDANNMLEGFSKFSPALQIMRKEGLGAAKEIAPLLVMLDQAGMKGEAAGNALRKVFQQAMTKGGKIGLDVTDGKGEFAGMDKLFSELAKLRQYDTQTRLDMIKTAFGDDAETLQTLMLIIDKGKAGYMEVQAKMEAQASLQERVNLQLGTLKNLWEAATGTFTNALVAVGESIAPEVKAITVWLGEVSAKAQAWARANPGLSSALMKTAAAVSAILVVLGTLSLTLAAILGPMAILRLSMAILGIKFSTVLAFVGRFGAGLLGMLPSLASIKGALSTVGTALLWLGRLAMAHPLIAIISVIAMGALYIWRNWGTLAPKFAALWSGIHSTMVAAWNNIMGFFTGLKDRFFAVGSQIIDGLRAGIESKYEAVKARIAGIASSIADSARNALGIRSPSRVFAEIGGFTMQGLAAGLMGNRAPFDAVRAVTGKLAAAGAGIALAAPLTAAAAPMPAMAASGGFGGASSSIVINVYAGPGMNEQSLAQQVAFEIEKYEKRKALKNKTRLSDLD